MKYNTKTNNAKAWESLYQENYQSGGSFLPAWGIHSAGHLLTPSLLRIEGSAILEVGCGIGESLPHILKNNPLSYIGIDISENAIAKAKKSNQATNVSFLKADMSKKFPFSDNSFDEVFSVYGLGWSKNVQKTLAEIYRTLKPGGTLTFSWDHYLVRVIDEYNDKVCFQNSYNTELPTIRYNWNQTGYNIQSYQARPSTWFQLLQKVGFQVTSFYEIDVSNTKELEHVFSNTYSKNKAKFVPSTVLMQAKKPL